MLILGLLLVAGLLASPTTVAGASSPGPTPGPPSRFVGETLSYSLRAVMTQSIAGKDTFGRQINQASTPTSIKLHESIAITKATQQDISLHRYGTITAVVVGAKPVTKSGQGWTTVDSRGLVVRDSGKLGGLFLLPLPFLANASMKEGAELAVGDRWSGRLGTKLYGMTARPNLTFTVTAERFVAGAKVYSIDAAGTVPMKEPVMTVAGDSLGYATGTADITTHFEYDRDNRRLVSMHAELNDTLHYRGPAKRLAGRVRDHQLCDVSLDSSSVSGSVRDEVNAEPSAGPLP
ncbi:MAG: hypothetical protein M3Z41_10945 [Candidatus Eremiobacteraeota bacterium]|nr:hypothetical protein [Candidatus Eremiobacteraeota bacterium]